MRAALALALLLAACNGAPEEASEAEIANRAQALEKSADATTDDLINQIDAQAAEDTAADGPAPAVAGVENASNVAQ